jgi:hypothetical protein
LRGQAGIGAADCPQFTAPARHGVTRPLPLQPWVRRDKPHPVFASRVPDADGADYTRRRDNTHKIEEHEVLYPWHPWVGRVVHVREVIEKRAGGVLHCSLDGSASARWLELPKWMFDRAASLSMRMEVDDDRLLEQSQSLDNPLLR